jgi:hypothetical protein
VFNQVAMMLIKKHLRKYHTTQQLHSDQVLAISNEKYQHLLKRKVELYYKSQEKGIV